MSCSKFSVVPSQRSLPQASVHKSSDRTESQVGTWTPLVTWPTIAEGGIGQHALELVPRDRLQDYPGILSEVPQYWIERAPQSVGGMIPRPMHIQGEFRQGIEPLDLRG
jgi:hypothetical protein